MDRILTRVFHYPHRSSVLAQTLTSPLTAVFEVVGNADSSIRAQREKLLYRADLFSIQCTTFCTKVCQLLSELDRSEVCRWYICERGTVRKERDDVFVPRIWSNFCYGK